MMPLAKLWTFLGNWFIPLAVAWAVYVRNGLVERVPAAVGISRAYWGLAVSLLVMATLIWAFALHVRTARAVGSNDLVPPNTTFEEREDRNLVISWLTVVVYAACVTGATVLFASTYAGSAVHCWDDRTPVAPGFWGSRLAAHHGTCRAGSYLAMASRFTDGNTAPLSGVNQYVPYLTDGILALLAIGVSLGVLYLPIAFLRAEGGGSAEQVSATGPGW